MTIRVTINNAGSNRLQARINHAANFVGGRQMRRLLEEQAGEVVKQFRANIDSFTPGSVQDLAESTKKAKERKYGKIYPILRATDEMYNSMKAFVVNTANGWAIRVRYSGSRNVVAQTHQDGNGRIPKRDFTKLPAGFGRRFWTEVRAALRR